MGTASTPHQQHHRAVPGPPPRRAPAGTDTSTDDPHGAAPEALLAALAERCADLQQRAEQLQTALTSRVIIEQAKGVLAERHGLTVDAAFEALRSHARRNNLRLHDLAAAVVNGHERAAHLLAAAG